MLACHAETRDHSQWQRAKARIESARLSLLVLLIIVTVATWVLTLGHALEMRGSAPFDPAALCSVSGNPISGMVLGGIGGMAGSSWSLTEATSFVALWTVMMAAMMLPAATPMILMFDAAQARVGEDTAPTWIFIAGYLLVWMVAGMVVYAAVQGGNRMADGLSVDRDHWAALALGGTLIVAGLYQFTSVKHVCLTRCRSPFAFVTSHWRDGRIGALQMGVQHGAHCLGCCWALCAVLAAAGFMSIAWMLLLTVLVFVEKVFPHGQRTASIVGLALIVLGLGIGSGAIPNLS